VIKLSTSPNARNRERCDQCRDRGAGGHLHTTWAAAPPHSIGRNAERQRPQQPIGSAATSAPATASNNDLAGRVFKDFPAPYNLPFPPHRFIGDKIIRLVKIPPAVNRFQTILQV